MFADLGYISSSYQYLFFQNQSSNQFNILIKKILKYFGTWISRQKIIEIDC